MTEEKRCCPKCGGTTGYYDRSVNTHSQYFDFDKQEVECHITNVRGGVRKFCQDCEKDITKHIDSLEKVDRYFFK